MSDLRAALEPFAKEADRYDPLEGDDGLPIWGEHSITIGDLRRARSALAGDGETFGDKLLAAMWKIHQREWPAGDIQRAARHASEMWDIADEILEQEPPRSLAGDGETVREILTELIEFVKDHKAQFYQPGWTDRDRDELMAIMHKGNVALSALPSPEEDDASKAFDFENEGVLLAEKASSWRGDWCDYAGVAENVLKEAYGVGRIAATAPSSITREAVNEIALKEANGWADRVRLSPGLDRDRLVKGQACNIRLDLEAAQQRFADMGYAIVLRPSHMPVRGENNLSRNPYGEDIED